MLLSADEVKAIADRILARSGADACTISMRGGEETTLRFARNSATTNASIGSVQVTIDSHIGARTGSVTVTSLDEAALAEAIARSEDIARRLPVNPEYMAPLGPQSYQAATSEDLRAAADATPLAEAAATAIRRGGERNVDVSGNAMAGSAFMAMATSAGLFAYDRHGKAALTVTARNAIDSWSGWAGASDASFPRIDAARIGSRAAEKADHDVPPLDLEPGRYTVILEPVAVAELMGFVLWAMDARSAEEGRSFLARKGGGTKLGETLFDTKITVSSDPADPAIPGPVFGSDGLPHRRSIWIDRGIVRTLFQSRYWAARTAENPIPPPPGFVIAGGDVSIDEMIKGTKRGLLVTRFWYTNLVDPQSLVVTGLTRDGNFFIENGRIVAPARNLRFNESAVALFGRVAALGPTERVWWEANGGGGICAPPLLAEQFTFSSKSSGI